MKYNRIMPRDDDSFYLWYDSLKGFRLNIIGEGNCNFNQEAEVLFQIERERIIELLEPLFDTAENAETRRLLTMAIAAIKGENK
jgi:hypothetical protein